MRMKRCGVLLLAIIAGCGDDPIGPNDVAGIYRLVSVNGRPLPFVTPPSLGSITIVDHGDLHLRPNGTYGLGIGGNFGWLAEGTFRVSDDEVRLLPPKGLGDTTVVLLDADSAVIQVEFRYVFKRASTANVLSPGIFPLVAINGRGPPLTEYDTVINGERFAGRVLYDTIAFIDGVFYRRHRHEEAVRYTTDGDSLKNSLEWNGFGGYDVVPGAVVLRTYMRLDNEPRRDTLWTVGSDLVRRTHFMTGIQEDRYARR